MKKNHGGETSGETSDEKIKKINLISNSPYKNISESKFNIELKMENIDISPSVLKKLIKNYDCSGISDEVHFDNEIIKLGDEMTFFLPQGEKKNNSKKQINESDITLDDIINYDETIC